MFEYKTVESPKTEQVKIMFTQDELAWIDAEVEQYKLLSRQDLIRMSLAHLRENG